MFVTGGRSSTPGEVALRERFHIHHLVQAGPHQLCQHREGKTIPLLVSQCQHQKNHHRYANVLCTKFGIYHVLNYIR